MLTVFPALSNPRKRILAFLQTHRLGNLVERDLDEDSATGSRVVLSQLDAFQNTPGDRIRAKEMSKEASNITKTVCLVPMDRLVVVCERPFEAFVPYPIQFAETFTNKTVEIGI